VILVGAALAAVLGYASLKGAVVATLDVAAHAGFAMTQGAPGIEPESLQRGTATGAR